MSNLSPFVSEIQVEQSRSNAAVSESLVQQLGQNVNFYNTKTYIESKIDVVFTSIPFNNYPIAMFVFDQNAFIVNAGMYVSNNDGSGSNATSFDMVHYPAPASAGASIFSSIPKILGNVANNTYTYFGAPAIAGVTAPVFAGGATAIGVSAGAAIGVRFNAGIQSSAATGCGAWIHYRQTN